MKNNLKNNFSTNLKKYMSMNNESQYDLADAIGVTQQSVSYWLQEKMFPRSDVIERIARHYGVTEMDLVEGKAEHSTFYADDELVDWCQDAFTKENEEKYELLKIISSLPEDQYETILEMIIDYNEIPPSNSPILADRIKRADILRKIK